MKEENGEKKKVNGKVRRGGGAAGGGVNGSEEKMVEKVDNDGKETGGGEGRYQAGNRQEFRHGGVEKRMGREGGNGEDGGEIATRRRGIGKRRMGSEARRWWMGNWDKEEKEMERIWKRST